MRDRRKGWEAGRARALRWAWLAAGAWIGPPAPTARADVPFPTCAQVACSDPSDFGAYLNTSTAGLPDDYDPNSGEAWKYAPDSGVDVPGVWEWTTGRPDVVDAVLDSGIEWDRADLARMVWLNTGELPIPEGCVSQDCNGDGFVSVDDFAAVCVDSNGTGFCDGQDLIRQYSDGVDDDGNDYVDDIAGWDFLDDDNDPSDDVRYGHGTGEAGDQVAEANNGSGFPGFAPSSLFLPLKVADSFVAFDADFARAVVYATDRGVAVISEALGTVNATPTGQAAVDYAYRRGIPIIASAADEESRHHNYPANYEHTIWVNSVRNGDGDFLDETANGYDLLNGCTNYGGRAWVAIPSASCSSEATGRGAGLTLLLISHAKNLIERGDFSPYPGLGTPLSAEEVRQLLRASARDVDHSEDLSVLPGLVGSVLGIVLSAPGLDLFFGSARFPTLPGWDQFTGFGRPDGPPLLALVANGKMPPEVDLSGGPRWFESIDPVATPSVELRGTLRAVRAGNDFDWTLEVGCGVQPTSFAPIAAGSADAPLEGAVLAAWDPAATAATCGFDPAATIESPDDHTVTLRLRATTETSENGGEDLRTLSIHSDPTLRFVRFLGGSGESSPELADVDLDGVLDIVQATSDGVVRAIDGATGDDLPGFPVFTEPLAVHDSPAYSGGEVPVPREAIIAGLATGDLDGEGGPEIVAAGAQGRLYVFDREGDPRPGFPVHTDPALSDPANRNPLNDTHPGIAGTPALADLDGDGVLEIVHSALDGHLYAWRANGSGFPGFPVRLADPAKVSVDPATGVATPLPDAGARERAAKILSSPAVGDLDGDGNVEIVVATNEEYDEGALTFAIESPLLQALSQIPGIDDALDFDTAGRVYAVSRLGTLDPDGPFVAGWPAPVPLLAPGVLPTVGTGTPGSPALADVDADGTLEVAIFGAIGPVVLLLSDGSPYHGFAGPQRVLAHDFPAGFPNVPASAGSADAPFFGALGSGAFGDLTGDGLPEYVAPTGGLRKLLDVAAPAWQDRVDPADPTRVIEGFAHHQITAWDPALGVLLDAFPRVMDDMQFIASPALVDVDGDGRQDVVQGSGAYLIRAYRFDGTTPPGFPKFTHGWHIASPTAADVDGDGKTELVAATREGSLFVWDTPAAEILVVDRTDDAPGTPCTSDAGDCSLRGAIERARGVVQVPPGIYYPVLGAFTVFSQGLEIVGAGAGLTVLDGGSSTTPLFCNSHGLGGDFVLGVTYGASATVSDLTVTGGRSGGIANSGDLVLERVVVTGNCGTSGAGISHHQGTLLVRDSTIAGNVAARGSLPNAGGGLYSHAAATLVNVTVSGNSADLGGGIYADGGLEEVCGPECSLVLENVTVTGNAAGEGGCALHNLGELESTNATLGFCTLGSNALDHVGTGGSVTNTIVAGGCVNSAAGGAALLSGGGNLDRFGGCGFAGPGDLADLDPGLGPLLPNGGPTLTHAPLPGSPAIDAGVDGACPDTDQRGETRPRDGDGDGAAHCDMGAVELVPEPAAGLLGSTALVALAALARRRRCGG